MYEATSAKAQEDRVEELIAAAVKTQGKLSRAIVYLRKAILLRPGQARCSRIMDLASQCLGRGRETPRVSAPAPVQATQAAVTQSEQQGVPREGPPAGMADAAPAAAGDATAELPALTAAQLPAFLEMLSGCLADIAATEQLMAEKGSAGEETLAAIKDARLELTVQLYKSRPSRQAGEPPPPPPEADPSAGIPAAVPPEYWGIPAFSRTLGPGAVQRGQEVTELQKLLKLEGLEVPISGEFDRRTAQAISRLQEKYKLKIRNGVVGSETRQLLNRLVGKSQ